MKLCDYGCGREAKFPFKSGKWCCSEKWVSCPAQREKMSKSLKGKNKRSCSEETKIKIGNSLKGRKRGPCSEETRHKISKKLKGLKRSEKTKQLQSEGAIKRYKNKDEREKQTIRMTEIWKDPMRRVIASKRQKKKFSDIKERQRFSKHMKELYKDPKIRNKFKRTIEKIKEKYPTFYKEEEMRYNPNNPKEKEIQVHCKNHECENSKEKDGWFTPVGRQIELRISCIELITGNDGGYFYCSEKCKLECCLYRFREDPYLLPKFERYKNIVYKETYKTIKLNNHKIENIKLRSRECPLDHKYSIYQGFINNVEPKLIAHWKNLEIIPVSVNSSKQDKCSITLDELNNF